MIDPDKHLQVFTPINNKLLLVGFYMLAVLLCAGPLYGWGEYSNFKGKDRKISVFQTATQNLIYMTKFHNVNGPCRIIHFPGSLALRSEP